ncbi:MAG: hypothetical protein HZB26_07485 [Candidatus Hydrogenedentes bacterium]|nr:hypothetical protein [Candidatus Hydrogenedentota bacterium]
MDKKVIGMYVHQHWAYNHPYAARTWSLEDWRGYVGGLKRLGYNAVMIWPLLETMPDPLTPSDIANIEKIARVIDLLKSEFCMQAYVTLSPNVVARNEEASKFAFEDRPFFYCDERIDPSDATARAEMISWRERLLEPLSRMDGLVIIDSDPGGYAGSTNAEFVQLLEDHRHMLDRLRNGIELVYWIHAGWQAYGRFYATAHFEWGPDDEVAETIALLSSRNLEPWGITGARQHVVEQVGLGDRMFTFPYGTIEGEPSFPLTNFETGVGEKVRQNLGRQGIMGNAQTHCLQLPNTFAFARAAKGLAVTEADYVRFAGELIEGAGERIVACWTALAGHAPDAMDEAVTSVEAIQRNPIEEGPLGGLLFGNPRRFLSDLALQLRLVAAWKRFQSVVCAEPRDTKTAASLLGSFANAAEAWQGVHGYGNNWSWPGLVEALQSFGDLELDAALETRNYIAEGATPSERLRNGFALVETYTPRLITAMKAAARRRA